MIYDITHALFALRPGLQWVHRGDDYSGLEWNDDPTLKPTEAELIAKIAELNSPEPMRLLRLERDKRLAETDWVTLRAYSQGTPVSQEWMAYMQALRDITDTAAPSLKDNGMLDLSSVNWPQKPE